jgi:SAM-dependent methyltransferase
MTESVEFPQTHYDTFKLVTRGRKSKLPHVAVMRFVYSNGAFYVISGRKKSDWTLNATSVKEATVRLGDYAQLVRCETNEDPDEVFGLFINKYGKRVVTDWYSASGSCLKLTPIGPLVVRGRIRGENESTTDFRSWRLSGKDYYTAVSEAFDSASDEYDFTIRQNFINVWIRNRSIDELLLLTRPDDVLLEIGSGTGVEALRISKHVRGIVATDISNSMISLLEQKVATRGLGDKIKPVRLAGSEIGKASMYLPNGKVRLAYSFNGALNCELKIREFPFELWKITQPKGLFVCSIRNTFCLSEAIFHAAVLQLNRMAPRKRQPVMVSVGGMDIPSYYYSPRKFAKIFEKYFKLKRMIGLPSILPPAYLSDFYVRVRKSLFFLESAEKALSSHYPLNRVGDQTLMIFERRDI